jgi:putative DNA primase/helicase
MSERLWTPGAGSSSSPASPYDQPDKADDDHHHLDRHSGNARFAYRMLRHYRGEFIYVHGVGWHRWDGTRWKPDYDAAAASRAVLATLRAAWPELEAMDDEDRKRLIRDIKACESASGQAGVLQIARRLEPYAHTVDEIDADPYLFNTPSGTYDLRTGECRDHDPADLITKMAGAAPSSWPPATEWIRFLERVLPDEEIRAFVQRHLGAALLGMVRDEVLPIWTGTGANGKSTLENAVGVAGGDYCITVDPTMLMAKSKHSDRIPTETMDLLGARQVFAHETGQGRDLDAAAVKALTSVGKVRARRMRQDPVEFQMTHSLVLVTNHPPRVPPDDPAIWRRLHVVPFDVVLPRKEWDLGLGGKLRLELGGIVRWLLDGYAMYAETGLAPPPSVTAATDAYHADLDTIARFVQERCAVETDGGAPLSEAAGTLYAAYDEWCRTNREAPLSSHEFRPAMGRRGYR